MESIKRHLIEKALKKYKNIYPCVQKVSFQDCFTTVGPQILFWFNTEDHSTHVMNYNKEEYGLETSEK